MNGCTRSWSRWGGLYFPTWSRLDTLLVGAFLALWLRDVKIDVAGLRAIAVALVCAPLISFFVLWKLSGPHTTQVTCDPIVVTLGFTLVALVSAGVLILALDSGSRIGKALQTPVLIWIGRRSYGLYLLHGVVCGFFIQNLPRLHRTHLSTVSMVVIGPSLSAGLAWLSFRYLESPFLALKPKLAPRKGAADDPPPYPLRQHMELQGMSD